MKAITPTLHETICDMKWIATEIRAHDCLYHQGVNPYNAMVVIANGGLRFGEYLEKTIWCPKIEVTIRFYRDDKLTHPVPIVKGLDEVKTIKPPFLLVDDILDTGTTIQYFMEKTGFLSTDFDLATLHWCQENSPDLRPTFFRNKKSKDEWITYPWEREVGFDEVWQHVVA